MLLQPFLSELVARKNLEAISINLNCTSNCHICWSDIRIFFVSIFVFASLKELAFNYTWVLLSWFKDWYWIISKEEGYNEFAIDIFWHSCVKSGCESKNCLVVINILEKVLFRLFWKEFEDITKRIYFISEAVVRWNLFRGGFFWLRIFDLTKGEVSTILCLIEFSCKLINTRDNKGATIRIDCLSWVYLIASQIVISNLSLTRLTDSKAVWELSTL